MFNINEYIKTREGTTSQWPVDPDTRKRIERLTAVEVRHEVKRSAVRVYALIIALGVSVIMFGLFWILSGGN